MGDWSEPESKQVNEYGSKAKIGNSETGKYSDWRRTIGNGCYANDVDWVEWRRGINGKPKPVAIIEITFYEDKPELRHCLPKYCDACLDRFKRDGQYQITRLISEALQVPAYFVLARYDLEVFFVCRLRDEQWREWEQQLYKKWIKAL